jgi:MerR family transcriptional regulator, heat shock protein HspR
MTRRDRDDGPGQPPHSQGVYGIAVTSDLVGRGVQNLRAYEKAGLLDPARTAGGTRLYSSDDVARLRRIQVLLARGLNLAGIAMVLELEEKNQHLRDQRARKGNDRHLANRQLVDMPDSSQPRAGTDDRADGNRRWSACIWPLRATTAAAVGASPRARVRQAQQG